MEYIWDMCYGDIVPCLRCGTGTRHYRVKSRKQYACSRCGHHFAPLAHTIFRSTKLPLSIWFYALYLFSVNEKEMSAKKIERMLGVTYETAWGMLKKMRGMVATERYRAYVESERGRSGAAGRSAAERSGAGGVSVAVAGGASRASGLLP